jgi:fatty acid desaturase
MQYRLVLAAHEGVHKNLFHPPALNDALCVFLTGLVGVSFLNYRRAHLEHHRMPQSIQDDIDGYIYRPLLRARRGWPRLLLLVFGIWVDVYVKMRRKFFGQSVAAGSSPGAAEPPPSAGELFRQLAPITLLQLALWALFWWQINWWSYLVFWFLPIFVLALSLDRARTFLEHSYCYFFPGPPIADLAVAPQDTVDVETNFLEAYFFAPFGFTEHLAHHVQMNVPFYHLPRARVVLEASDPAYHRRIRGSYLVILLRLLWAERAPEAPPPASKPTSTSTSASASASGPGPAVRPA